MHDLLLTTKQAAQILGVSIAFLERDSLFQYEMSLKEVRISSEK